MKNNPVGNGSDGQSHGSIMVLWIWSAVPTTKTQRTQTFCFEPLGCQTILFKGNPKSWFKLLWILVIWWEMKCKNIMIAPDTIWEWWEMQKSDLWKKTLVTFADDPMSFLYFSSFQNYMIIIMFWVSSDPVNHFRTPKHFFNLKLYRKQ